MLMLNEIHIRGYKSYGGQDEHVVPFGKVTVLIGANGAGKSNLVSVFRLLNYAFTGALQNYVRRTDPATFFFEGPKRTPFIDLSFCLKDENGSKDRYALRFGFGNPDRFLVMSEEVTYQKPDSGHPQIITLSPGFSGELGLWESHDAMTQKVVYAALSQMRVYQFHDTSDAARIKLPSNTRERFLKSDGGNLSAFLYHLKCDRPKHYERIRRHVQRVMPQFDDFDLVPDVRDNVLLNWRMRGDVDGIYGPHQISDGSLRFMALAALLLQPKETLPSVIVIDEPELGLHPAAIIELVGMVRMASESAQVVLATQSPLLMNEFEPSEIVVVERDENRRCSVCQTLDEKRLATWLEDYSLSDLWEKNLLGGRP